MEIMRIKFGENQVPSIVNSLEFCVSVIMTAHAPKSQPLFAFTYDVRTWRMKVAHKQTIVLGSCMSVTKVKGHLSMAPSHIMISCLNWEEESQKAHERFQIKQFVPAAVRMLGQSLQN